MVALVQYEYTSKEKIDWKKVKYHTSDSKHLTVIPAFAWTISSEQQHQCTSMIIDKHREYLHTFQKGNEQAINIIFIQFYFK
jgi:hypothetical protein